MISALVAAIVFIVVFICRVSHIEHRHTFVVSEPYATSTPGVYVAIARYPLDLSDELQQYTIQLCNANGIEPSIVFAIIQYESECVSDCVGDNGQSFGLMQIQPYWFSDTMKSLGCTDLTDPYQNITVGVAILRDYYSQCEDTQWVLTAYNAGVNSANLHMFSQYAADVMEIAEEMDEGVQTGLMSQEVKEG